VVNQSKFDFVIQERILPHPETAQVLTLATIMAYTTAPPLGFQLSLNLNELAFFQGSGVTSSNQLGLYFQDEHLVVNATLRKFIRSLSWPLTGDVVITDNRTWCEQASFLNSQETLEGPCTSRIPFTLHILTDFNPACPHDIFVFSPEDPAHVPWTPPQVYRQDGSSFPLATNRTNGSEFLIGRTVVLYSPYGADNPADPSQLPETFIQCQFQVSVAAASIRVFRCVCLKSSCTQLNCTD
jgi:hypothetical protein